MTSARLFFAVFPVLRFASSDNKAMISMHRMSTKDLDAARAGAFATN
jgi:hypothetical protein